MRASEVYTYLSGGYYKHYKPPRRLLSGFTNLWPKYVLKFQALYWSRFFFFFDIKSLVLQRFRNEFRSIKSEKLT